MDGAGVLVFPKVQADWLPKLGALEADAGCAFDSEMLANGDFAAAAGAPLEADVARLANGFALGAAGALGAGAAGPRRLGRPRMGRFCGTGAGALSVSAGSAGTACGSSPSSRWIWRSAMRFMAAHAVGNGKSGGRYNTHLH